MYNVENMLPFDSKEKSRIREGPSSQHLDWICMDTPSVQQPVVVLEGISSIKMCMYLCRYFVLPLSNVTVRS